MAAFLDQIVAKTRRKVDEAKRGADLDLFYIANWSLRFDLTIMIRTVLVGLTGRNVF